MRTRRHREDRQSTKLSPLYKDLPENLSPQNGNAGLWYDKFCHTWRKEGGIWKLSSGREGENPKLEWIKTVANERKVGNDEQIKEAVSRLRRLVESLGGRVIQLSNTYRFVTGLGRTHPVENGFAWHHSLGTPYLPGSSVKGMVRAWVKENRLAGQDEIERLFGEDRKTCPTGPGGAADLSDEEEEHDKKGVGAVCFMDALPAEPVHLAADVMTPHYAGWDEKNPPGDWLSPTPIPFLVMEEGTPFLFGIAPRPRGGVRDGDLEKVEKWLKEALEWSGAGAKTAVGYGRFGVPESVPEKKPQPTPVVELNVGDTVRARLLEEKTKKGGWKAQHLETGKEGHIINTADVPADAKPGQEVDLRVKVIGVDGSVVFEWPRS